MSDTTFGFIGLGDMGAPITTRLIEQGCKVVVYDINNSVVQQLVGLGGIEAASVADVASKAEVVFACLPTPAICVAVATEFAASPSRRATIYAEMSTVGVKTICEIEAVLANAGVALIDSPISGGPKAVPLGKLTCLASGPTDAIEAARPAYDAVAGQFFHLSEKVGTAQTMKVGNNLLAAYNLAITSEIVCMLERAGVEPAVAIEVINASTGRNRASEVHFPTQILNGLFSQGARLEILTKDTQLAAEAAEFHDAPFTLGNAVRDAWAAADADGFGESDITAIYQWTKTLRR